MPMKMNDFLSEFYKRLIFRDMSIEQFAQYCSYVKANDFNGNMKKWTDLLEKDATGKLVVDNATKLYVRKNLPTDADLDPGEWEKLYRAFQSAFRNMAGARSSLDEKTVKFLDKYFGKDLTATPPVSRMFDSASANARADNLIQTTLKNFLIGKELEFKLILKRDGLLNDDFTFQNLIEGINSRKYNTDPKFQRRLMNVVEYIVASDAEDLKKALKLRIGEQIPDLTDIRTGFNTDIVNPYQLNNFKLEYDTLLRALYSEPKILADFQNYDDGKISKPLNKAKEHLKYSDPSSPDYVKPKREDELTIAQRISDFARDTYADYLEKYISLNGDRFFFSDEAKAIVSGLKKVKPTDGLAGLLKEAAGLEKNLKSAGKFKASKHAKWLTDTLTDFSGDKNMSRIFAGALKNSTHMKALIRELIFKAVREGKIDEAKTAMEVLSVMKYGYTTSKIMDAMRKEPLSIFSDKGLSWNKNQGMQFVTTALDKSIKAAFVGIGYGLTFARNAIRLSNSKIKKTTGALNQERKDRLQADADAKSHLDNQIALEQAQISNVNSIIDGHLTAGGARIAPDAYKTNLNTAMTTANADLQTAKNDVANALTTVIDWLNDAANRTDPNYNSVYDYYSAVYAAWESNGAGHATLPVLPAGMTFAGVPASTIENDIRTALQNMESRTHDYDDANDKLTEFTNAENTLSALTDQLARHTAESGAWDDNHHDHVEELINYWNMLESGRNTHSGPMYSWFGRKKTQENKFKNIRGNIIQHAMQNSIQMAA